MQIRLIKVQHGIGVVIIRSPSALNGKIASISINELIHQGINRINQVGEIEATYRNGSVVTK